MTTTILDVLNDPNLFGGLFDAPSWTPWKVFLAALFGLPMDGAALASYRHHTGRQRPPSRPSRYAQLVVGRRGGKSRILGLVAVFLACMIDHSPFIVPGENLVIAIIAADRKQAKVIFNYVSGLLRARSMLASMIEDELAESIRLTNNVIVEIHTAAIGAPRGRTFLAILADETAFWKMDDSSNPDVEVINAVRPGLSTIPYSLLLIASSPYAKRGILYGNYAKHFGVDDAPVFVWQGATWEMNSALADDPLIAEMYAEDPERAEAEFGAKFRSDIVAFITREAVEDVIARGIRELPPAQGLSYVGHVDPSGGSADSMTLAIAHLDADQVAVLDAVREVKPPFSPDAVVADFADLLKAYSISRVTGDAYAGAWPRERFALRGITYDVSKRNTSTIYTEFLPALNGRRVRLLDIPRLTGQLVGLERRTARAGRDSIAHAPGSHDDVANAACGALVQVLSEHRPALIKADNLLADGLAVPLPNRANGIMAVLIIGLDGMAATVFFAHNKANLPPPFYRSVLLDFDVAPQSAETLGMVVTRLVGLSKQIKLFVPNGISIFLPKQWMRQARLMNLRAQEIPDDLLFDPPALALDAAVNVLFEKVKYSLPAWEKAQTHPLAGSLNFRPGEPLDADPLRLAMLAAISILMDDRSKTRAA